MEKILEIFENKGYEFVEELVIVTKDGEKSYFDPTYVNYEEFFILKENDWLSFEYFTENTFANKSVTMIHRNNIKEIKVKLHRFYK